MFFGKRPFAFHDLPSSAPLQFLELFQDGFAVSIDGDFFTNDMGELDEEFRDLLDGNDVGALFGISFGLDVFQCPGGGAPILFFFGGGIDSCNPIEFCAVAGAAESL